MEEKTKQIVENALQLALDAGAEHARITYNQNRQSCVSVLGKEIDKINQSCGSSMYIQIFTDGRYGAFSTNQLEGREVENLIRKGIQITKLVAEDPDRCLPDPELYFKKTENTPDLCLEDKTYNEIPTELKKELALNTSAEIYGTDSRLVFNASEYNDSYDYNYMIDSNGFRGEDIQTRFSLSCECGVKGRSDSRPEAWFYESALFLKDMQRSDVGRKALQRALDRLNPKKIRSGKYNTVIEYRVASKLLNPILNSLNGAAVHNKQSFLIGREGKKVFGDNLTLIDRPHLVGAGGARYFDGEGIATHDMDIIRDGAIMSYYILPYYSKKLGMPVTIESPSVLSFEASGEYISEDAASMIRSLEKGIYITGFNGGNCNQTTGDFSFGVEGFYFEQGQIRFPIKEMNITGNMITLWNQLLLVGKDFNPSTNWRVPSLAFGNADFNGI